MDWHLEVDYITNDVHYCCCTLIRQNSYIIEGRVCYLTLCDRSYPKKLAFQYLEDLKNEFEKVNGSQIETAARPYAFIKFGMVPFSCSIVVFTYFSIFLLVYSLYVSA